jgi:hypothetical protein
MMGGGNQMQQQMQGQGMGGGNNMMQRMMGGGNQMQQMMQGGGGGGKFGGGAPSPGGAMAGGSFTSQPQEDVDLDSDPFIIQAIVEVKHAEVKENRTTGRIHIKTKYGETSIPYDPRSVEIHVVKIKTIAEQFVEQRQLRKIKEDDPVPEKERKILQLAEWALGHGLLDKVPELMAELTAVNSKNPAAVAFQKVQEQMNRKLDRDDAAAVWGERLGEYKPLRSSHYTLYYEGTDDTEAKNHLALLETTYQGFFYWFALNGTALNLPTTRLVAILVKDKQDFINKHEEIFDDYALDNDGIFATRENIALFCATPLEPSYQTLEGLLKEVQKTHNWTPEELLKGKGARRNVDYNDVARAQALTLIYTAMKNETQLASITHEGTRQLIAALNLLPRSVKAPQWIDFGMASFFDTPKGSFWSGFGAATFPYRRDFGEMNQAGTLERPAAGALKKVVTDAYFGEIKDGKNRKRDTAKAKAMTWSLVYFLAHKHRAGLLKYYSELAVLPRDMEFDEQILLEVFARAFGLTNPKGEINQGQLARLADEWYKYILATSLEVEDKTKESALRRRANPAMLRAAPQGNRQPVPGNQGGGAPPP